MTDAVFALDDDWRFTYLNERAAAVLDADESDLLGEAVWDAFPEARETTFSREYRRAVNEQEPVSFEEYYEPLGKRFSVRAFPSETGLTVYFRDVTAEQERRAELERERERLAVRDRFDAVFADTAELGSTASTAEEFQDQLLGRLNRVDGVHSVRIDSADASDGRRETLQTAGEFEFADSPPAVFERAVERRAVARAPISETDGSEFDSRSAELVCIPILRSNRFSGVLSLVVDSALQSNVDDDLFERLGRTVGSVLDNVARSETWRSVVDAFERVDEGAYVVDAEGTIVWANEAFTEYVGIDVGEVVGSDHDTFVERRLDPVFADDCPVTTSPADATAADDSRVARVHESYSRDERVLDYTRRPVDVGRFDGGAVHVFEDVTDRVETEETLAEMEWIRASLLDNFPGMVYRCHNTRGWEMDYVSGRVSSLTGYDAEEIRSDVSWAETVVDSRDRQEVWEAIQSQLAESDTFEVTYRIVRRDGTVRWVWERGVRMETDEGERLAGYINDVTEKREAKDRLQWEEDRFESVVEHVTEYAIFTVDEDGYIESWNDGAKYITGFDAEEATDIHLSSFVPMDRDDRYLVESHMTEATLEGESHGEGWLQTKNGSEFWARVVLRAIDDDTDEVGGFVAVVRDMTDQRQRRRELERQRDELATLDRINGVIRDIDRALVRARTRQEICTAICERLAGDDRYRLAWIGESDPARNAITPIQWAGEGGGYVEDIEVTLDGERGTGPAGRSLQTQSVAVTQQIDDDSQFEPWRAEALDRGFRSSASVPIEYDGIPYGVLCVYSGESQAFDEREQELLAELGEMVGYAFNAVDRKQALIEDSMTEMTVETSESHPRISALTEESGGRIAVTNTVQTASGTFLQYLRTEGVAPDDVAAILEESDAVESVEVLWNREVNGSLSVSLSEAPFTQTVSVYGGKVESIVAEDGTVSVDIRFPKGANIRAVTDQLRDLYSGLEVVAKRTISSADEAQHLGSLVEDALTDRQAEVLRTAYHAGYYEWPRDTNGTKLSEKLDLSAATVSQHLRAAHDKVVGNVVEHGRQ